MSAVPKPTYTFEEYLAREKNALTKSEYYRGQIFAMAGASPRHNMIAVNAVASLRVRLRGSPCRPFHSDQRIRIPASGLATYPDVSIVCGDLQLDAVDRDAIVNPRVICEVLSKSTESYDRGKKFDLYRQLESLQEYVLVAQDEPQVDHYVLQAHGSWLLTVFKGLEAKLEFPSLSIELLLSEIYEDIEFGPEEGSTDDAAARPSKY